MEEKKYIDAFNEKFNIFSEDLLMVFKYIDEDLLKELPTITVSIEYLITAIFRCKNCLAYDAMSVISSEMTLDMVYSAFFKLINSKSISVVKPNRQIKISDDIINCVNAADEERKVTKTDKIDSAHILMALLNENFQNKHFVSALNKIGITYDRIKEIYLTYQQSDNIIDDNEDIIVTKKNNNEKVDKIKVTLDTGNFISSPSDKVKNEYCININAEARKGKIQKVVGREKEFSEIIRTLGRRKKNNIVLVGAEGVGKTAICEGLANLIEDKKVPNNLLEKEILSLNMTALIAGTTLRGMFEERVQNLISFLTKEKKYILFIDNIDSVLKDKGKNDYDISSMLSAVLENGDVQIIGTSSYKGFRNTFDSNPSLFRKFQKLQIEAPTIEETKLIINAVKEEYEAFHKVKYSDEALESCVVLADKFITDRNLPDSAIDLLDESGSELNSEYSSNNKESSDIIQSINDIQKQINEHKINEEYEIVDELILSKKKLVSKMYSINEKFNKERDENPPVVTTDRILGILSEKTGMPINKLSIDEKKKLVNIEERLSKEVIGQKDAVDSVCRSLKRNRVGLRNGRTMGAFMMLGPTGTGKTLLAKKLAKEMFGDEKALIRFDMSEYTDKTSVNKLIGANPGYVGYEEGGLMTEAVKNKKHCVLLLDEIEKADQEVYNMFLQVFDEGFLTDNTGQRIDFKNVIIILTSNVGVKMANEFGNGIGFIEDKDKNKKKILEKELKKKFSPEFLNRLDNIVYFNSLTPENLKSIIRIEMNNLKDKIIKMGCAILYDENAIDFIYNKIKDDNEYGARPILRAIQDEFEDKITDNILENDYGGCHIFSLSFLNNEVIIS